MTEAEAKKKRCIGPSDCGTLVEISKRMTPSGDTLTERIRMCNGAACMGWRRDNDKSPKVENRKGQLVDRDLDETGRWHYEGYCGLAGKP